MKKEQRFSRQKKKTEREWQKDTFDKQTNRERMIKLDRKKEIKSERFGPEDNLSVKNGLEPYLQACQDRRQEYRK